MKKNLLVCRSGGRTSEFMYKWLLENKSSEYNIVGIFANTGWEHHKTIEFVNNNDIDNRERFGVEPVWVEAVVNDGRVACTHKQVTYETASRDMEPFVEVVKKYGLPNAAYPHCTRELKENPIHDYVENVLGWSNTKQGKPIKKTNPLNGNQVITFFGGYNTALGIRIDEPKRFLGMKALSIAKKVGINQDDLIELRDVGMCGFFHKENESHKEQIEALTSNCLNHCYGKNWFWGEKCKGDNDDFNALIDTFKPENTPQNKVYPLADWFEDKPDKLDILDWWEDYSFDLGIPEHLGNCVGCFRKSERKCMKAYRDAPGQFYNTIEKDYGHIGPNKINGVHSDLPRTMYRKYNTCMEIIQMFHEADSKWLSKGDPEHLNEGCASSCEPFA